MCRRLFKIIWTIKSLTLFLGLATAYLGWETYQLRLADEGPHITISDVQLELIDSNGSPFKDRSWIEGETLNKNATQNHVQYALVSVKFSNSGKQPGYVSVASYNQGPLVGAQLLVVGDGQSGWAYPIDIAPEIKANGIKELSYDLKVYDINKKKVDDRTVVVSCFFPVAISSAINAMCMPAEIKL